MIFAQVLSPDTFLWAALAGALTGLAIVLYLLISDYLRRAR